MSTLQISPSMEGSLQNSGLNRAHNLQKAMTNGLRLLRLCSFFFLLRKTVHMRRSSKKQSFFRWKVRPFSYDFLQPNNSKKCRDFVYLTWKSPWYADANNAFPDDVLISPLLFLKGNAQLQSLKYELQWEVGYELSLGLYGITYGSLWPFTCSFIAGIQMWKAVSILERPV